MANVYKRDNILDLQSLIINLKANILLSFRLLSFRRVILLTFIIYLQLMMDLRYMSEVFMKPPKTEHGLLWYRECTRLCSRERAVQSRGKVTRITTDVSRRLISVCICHLY